MQVSEAKLEANRRNAKLSSGPKTAAGKERSSRNAVTHGLRAEKLIVLEEDPQVLDDRRAAWRACLLPGDDVEERLVDSAVVHTWMQDRARRAQASRINANMSNFGVDQGQTTEEEVVALGRRLFKDRLGPLVSYPTGSNNTGTHQFRTATTSFAGQQDDPDVPIDLVLRLQSTLLGCEWLLAEWARLKTILDQGQPWIPSDKLKGVRLLGKQPFDAIDDKDVAIIFLASFVLKEHKGLWDWEIVTEMNEDKRLTFRRNAATRQLDALTPSDATKAREALLEIIERATARLTTKAEAHRERARVMADLAPDFLAFDDSPDGERLRRFELASGRALSRSLDDLRKHRHSFVRGPLSVVSSPLSVVRGPLSVVASEAEAAATNEPIAAGPNATNEPTIGPLSVVSSPLPVVSCAVEAVDEPNAPNEPTIGPLSVVSSPLPVVSCAVEAVDEPNAPNEPTIGPWSVVSSPLSVVSCAVEAVDDPNARTNPPLVRCPWSVVRCPLSVARSKRSTSRRRTNPPLVRCPWSVVRCPLSVARSKRLTSRMRRTNPPLVRCPWSVVRCPLSVARSKRSTSGMRRTNPPLVRCPWSVVRCPLSVARSKRLTSRMRRTNPPLVRCPWSVVRCPLSVARSKRLTSRMRRTNPPLFRRT